MERAVYSAWRVRSASRSVKGAAEKAISVTQRRGAVSPIVVRVIAVVRGEAVKRMDAAFRF